MAKLQSASDRDKISASRPRRADERGCEVYEKTALSAADARESAGARPAASVWDDPEFATQMLLASPLDTMIAPFRAYARAMEDAKRAAAQALEADWSESKHPRDKIGRWRAADGGASRSDSGAKAKVIAVSDPSPKPDEPTISSRNRLMTELTGDPAFADRNRRIADIHSAAKLPGDVVQGIMSGLKTGAKAEVNGFATAIKNVATLGLSDKQIELLGVTKEDRANGYDTAVAFTTASGQILIGVGTGGLATALSKGGVVA
jgi:hypothetical protein